MKLIGLLGKLLLGIFILSVAVSMLVDSFKTPEEKAAEDREKTCAEDAGYAYARGMAEKQVKDGLKAPSTATFSPSNDTKVQRYDDCSFVVDGWVDAQNGFGAMIRSPYHAKLKYNRRNDDGGSNWNIEYAYVD